MDLLQKFCLYITAAALILATILAIITYLIGCLVTKQLSIVFILPNIIVGFAVVYLALLLFELMRILTMSINEIINKINIIINNINILNNIEKRHNYLQFTCKKLKI